MYNRNDPRFRRTLNQISQNIESANESAQVGLFSISENYIKPCLTSINDFLDPCVKECFPDPRERSRRTARSRARSNRPEHSFDFYDDWEADETDALLALEDDEFDRVVGGYGTQDPGPQSPQQPSGHRSQMTYGQKGARPRRKSASNVLPYDVGPDPTVIPNQSYFGFLSRLPFNIGKGRLRYKPSAADLKDRANAKRKTSTEAGMLLEDDGEAEEEYDAEHLSPAPRINRKRSGTTSSGHTTDSFSSRGDLFPSDDEADAIPLDDEFTVALERRTTNSASGSGTGAAASNDDASSGRARRKNKAPPSNASSDGRPPSSPQSRKKKSARKSNTSTPRSANSVSSDPEMGELPTLAAIRHEDRQARADQAPATEKNLLEAERLPVERNLAPESREQHAEGEDGKDDAEAETASAPRQHDMSASRRRPEVIVADGPIQLQDNEADEQEYGSNG